jgi:hypothetical protein
MDDVTIDEVPGDVTVDLVEDEDVPIEEPTVVPITEPRYSLRKGRERNYDHKLAHQMDTTTSTKTYLPTQLCQHTPQQTVTAYIMTQMSVASGIKTYGKPAAEAILKEFCQLHDKGVLDPKMATTLTTQQKKGSLRAINLIKEKRSGELKGRTCADGSVQRE